MNPCKRIEIVIESAMAETLTDMLNELGVAGYTLLPDATGAGDRGYRRADQLTGDSSNCLVLVACEDLALVDRIIAGVKPLLARSGGMCLVSDAQLVVH